MKKFTLTAFLCLIFFGTYKAQQNQTLDAEKLIAFKISGYTAQKDKTLQEEFKKSDGYRIVYSCIPAGIVIVISNSSVSVSDKKTVTQKINNSGISNFTNIDNYGQERAEQECSATRSTQFINNPD